MTLDLDPTLLAGLAIGAVVVGVLGLLVAVVALRRVRRMRRDLTLLQGDDPSDSFLASVGRQVASVELLRSEVSAVQDEVAAVRVDLADAIRHVAVVRYDAFGDMGGRMSFSVAMLDDAGDGLVMSSINGRSETRTYAKGVQAGTSDATLSPEEEQAIGFAHRSHE
ncbi:MAG TPA: DUF4446 family protein [Actinomycetes bacterium]|nr:DUF4446 family protein [Actinomycetes bacterium]